MRSRVGELLKAKGWTAYRLAKESGGRISRSTAYELAQPHFVTISAKHLDVLCELLEIDDPGPLFARD